MLCKKSEEAMDELKFSEGASLLLTLDRNE
jgi:hypothetical protein